MDNIKKLEDLLGTVKTASEMDPMEFIPTGLIKLDNKVLCGGLPRSRYVEIHSKESTGKTSLALFLVAMVQKQGGKCVWFESEGAFTKEYAKQCGVDTDKLEIVDNFTTGQDCLYKIKQRLALNIYDLIVLDSNTKLIPETLGESKVDKNTMHDNMQLAKMNSEFFRSLSGYEIRDINDKLIKSDKKYYHGSTLKDTWHKLSDKKTCLVFIMHAMEDIGALAPGAVKSTGGSGSKFEASIRLTLKLRGTKKDSDGNLLYKKIDVIAIKNKIGVPYGYTTLLLHSDGTVEEENSDEALIDIGIEKDIFKHSGAWYFYNDIKFQGKNSLLEYIGQNPELKEEIIKK
jgi:recombination protein RecA